MSTSARHSTVFDFSFEAIDGQPLPLDAFRGKSLLVVNTASECKYLFDREGRFVTWFSTVTSPEADRVTDAMEAALRAEAA